MKKNPWQLQSVFLAIFLFGAMSAAAASGASILWLESGAAITTAQASTWTGEFEVVNLKTVIGTEAAVLCSGKFDGTIGPGAEDRITLFLSLFSTEITLPKMVLCTNISGCPKAELVPENLPWKTELELMDTEAEPLFLDKILNGGKGEPGYTLHCEVIGFPFEETCLGSVSANVINDVVEGDVLTIFEPGEETGKCDGSTTATAEVRTGTGDEEGLITLNSGLALSVSYE